MKHITSRSIRLPAALLLCYCICVLYYTVMLRAPGFWDAHWVLFWSYREWFGGRWEAGVQILANVALFVPVGFLFSFCTKKGGTVWKSLLAGFLFSCLVEGLQFWLMRGQLELDDLVSNTIGAAFGGIGAVLLQLWPSGRIAKSFVLLLGTLAVLVAACVCLQSKQHSYDYDTRNYCFQVEQAAQQADQIELRGFGLWYQHKAGTAVMYLVSTETGKKLPLSVSYGLEREDVDDYFRCAYDYSHCGFTANGSGLKAGEEYEIYASFGWTIPLPTGVYLRDGELCYAPEAVYRAPEGAGEELAALLEDSVLRAYLPQLPCWIVQRGATLYWIVSEDYPFEDDGSTLIQYGLWSSQMDRVAPEMIHDRLHCVNLKCQFEDFELAGDFGPYRVMKHIFPGDYSVTAVVTGCWSAEQGWVWKSCFRPVYAFSDGGQADESVVYNRGDRGGHFRRQ